MALVLPLDASNPRRPGEALVLAGSRRELAVEDEQVAAQKAAPTANTRSCSGMRSRGERLANGYAQNEGNSVNARWIERISLSFSTPMLKANGSGEAYQSWISDHARHAEQHAARESRGLAPAEIRLLYESRYVDRWCGRGFGHGIAGTAPCVATSGPSP